MSDSVLIALVIAITVVIVLLMFRSKLSRFSFRARTDEVAAELQTHETPGHVTETQAKEVQTNRRGVNVLGNWQIGKGNKIRVSDKKANIEDNRQLGEDQEIIVGDQKPRKKK